MDNARLSNSPTGFSADELLEAINNYGWYIAEKTLKQVGIIGEFTPNDLVNYAEHCWGIPKFITELRPELVAQINGQNLVDMVSIGPRGLSSVRAIFGHNPADLRATLSPAQLQKLKDSMNNIAEGPISTESDVGKEFIKLLLQKIAENNRQQRANITITVTVIQFGYFASSMNSREANTAKPDFFRNRNCM